MRVPIECMKSIEAAGNEAVDRLARHVSLVLVPAQHIVESRSRHQLAGEHASRAQLAHNTRDVDDRVVLVIPGEKLLVLGFKAIVDLLPQPLAQLINERASVQAREGRRGDPAQQSDVSHVRRDGARDAWVLNLDRHRPPISRDRPVHLPDGSGRERQWVPPREDALRRIAQLLQNHRARQLRSHRRSVVLQSGHGGAVGRRHVLVDVARHLAKLHEGAFHGA